MIEFDRVCLHLGDFELRNVSFHVRKGDYYFILGPSGAGKTVILEAIAGLHTPEHGSVRIRGDDGRGVAPEKRKIALVYQDYSLFPHMTVAENIAFGLRMRKTGSAQIGERINDLCASFGITALKDRYPPTMSGGEQQRVAIARALATEPDILLLDEPLAALDPMTREWFISELRTVHRTRGLTVVQVTHARDEALRLATRVAVIIDGEIAIEEDPLTLFNAPKNRRLALFVGFENVIDGIVTSTTGKPAEVSCGGCTIVSVQPAPPAGTPVCVCIRAEDISLVTHGDAPVKENAIPGTIRAVTEDGPLLRVVVDCGFPLLALVSRKQASHQVLYSGGSVVATFGADAVHLAEPDCETRLSRF